MLLNEPTPENVLTADRPEAPEGLEAEREEKNRAVSDGGEGADAVPAVSEDAAGAGGESDAETATVAIDAADEPSADDEADVSASSDAEAATVAGDGDGGSASTGRNAGADAAEGIGAGDGPDAEASTIAISGAAGDESDGPDATEAVGAGDGPDAEAATVEITGTARDEGAGSDAAEDAGEYSDVAASEVVGADAAEGIGEDSVVAASADAPTMNMAGLLKAGGAADGSASDATVPMPHVDDKPATAQTVPLANVAKFAPPTVPIPVLGSNSSTELALPDDAVAEAETVAFPRLVTADIALPDTVAEVVAVVDAASKAIAAAEDAARVVAEAHAQRAVERSAPPAVLDLREPAQPAVVEGVLDLLAPVLERPLLVVEQPALPSAPDLMALHRAEFELDYAEPPVVAAGDEPPIPTRFGPGLAVLPHIEFPV